MSNQASSMQYPAASSSQRLRAFVCQYWPELLIFALYFCLCGFVSAFHEPWFDEAQSWLIARDASLYDILFVIPHCEGHPPLWHLVLLPFAKLGAPYELTIKVLSIMISGIAVFLIVFRSPFPRIVRLILPFTYFVFYQYTVISRPYALLALAFLLVALAYQSRLSKPFRFTLALGLLCACSAYGILFAGGIAILWVFDLLSTRRNAPLSSLLKSPCVPAMICLLFFAVLLILEILPSSQAYAFNTAQEAENSLAVRLIYTLFVLPADSLMYNALSEEAVLRFYNFSYLNLGCGAFVGVVIWSLLLFYGYKKRKIALLLLPYALFAVFCATVYLGTHHVGIVMQYFLFWLWVCCEDSSSLRPLPSAQSQIESDESRSKLHRLIRVVVAAVLAIQLAWKVTASVQDVIYPYSFSRDLASFLKETGLSDAKIMMAWHQYDREDTEAAYQRGPDTSFISSFLPYFDHNIIYNFNGGQIQVGYVNHRLVSESEYDDLLLNWRATASPEVLLGRCNLSDVYPDNEYSISDFAAVYRYDSYSIWKTGVTQAWEYVYVRRDLLDQYGLTEIEVEPYFQVE